MRMPSSVTSVSPVSIKSGIASVLHTLKTGDLVLRDQHQYLMQHCNEKLPLLCDGPSVQNCHRHVNYFRHFWWANWPVNAHNIVFADFSEVCSGIVIQDLVLSLISAQKSRTTDLNTSSMYTWLIKRPSISTWSVVLGFKHLHLPRDLANVNVWKRMFAP